MRVIKWVLVNAVFVSAFWYGIVQGNEGAKNVVYFWTWTVIVLSFFAFHPDMEKKIRERGRSVPELVNTTFDLLIVGAFAWYGSFVTAAFYFLHFAIIESAYKDKKA